MAIFRAGKRIGNFDIRIGMPRDKSLDNVEGDKRLKDPFIAGTRKVSAINRFMAEIAKGEGVARPNRFLVRFYPPVGLDNSLINDDNMKRNVELMCTRAVLPSRDIKAENYVTYGPGRQMPQAYHYSSSIECNFMGDKYLRQRAFFETWQSLIYDKNSHDLRFYEDYVGTMDIYQLGMYKEDNQVMATSGMADNLRITYGVRLHEVYPETIGEVQYESLVDDPIPLDMPITFNFRTWDNLTIDQINEASRGASGQINNIFPNIRADSSKGLTGFIKNLPPELRRAGRDVLDKVRRDIPIGRTTGGRVFPPF